MYECVYNSGLGNSYLIDKKKSKNGHDVFLFFVEENNCHFIVCDGVTGDKERCSFSWARYYLNIEDALEAYKKS